MSKPSKCLGVIAVSNGLRKNSRSGRSKYTFYFWNIMETQHSHLPSSTLSTLIYISNQIPIKAFYVQSVTGIRCQLASGSGLITWSKNSHMAGSLFPKKLYCHLSADIHSNNLNDVHVHSNVKPLSVQNIDAPSEQKSFAIRNGFWITPISSICLNIYVYSRDQLKIASDIRFRHSPQINITLSALIG